MSREPWVVTLVVCRVLLLYHLEKQRENQNIVGRKMQKGLNANLNNSEGVGLRAISFLTFHIKTTSELHKTPPHLWNGNEVTHRWAPHVLKPPYLTLHYSQPSSLCSRGTTSLSSALATHALRLAMCLGFTQSQSQHWGMGSSVQGGCPQCLFIIWTTCVVVLSLCAHVFHLINLCCRSLLSLFSLLLQWAAAPAQDCPPGSIPPLSGLASGFIIY